MTLNITPYTFSSDFILNGLVSWFNALPEAQRAFASNDVPLFKVTLVTRDDGTPGIVVGPMAEGDKYEGEATFIWTAAKGTDLQATTSSFFEISKYIPGSATFTIRAVEAIAVELAPIVMGPVRWFVFDSTGAKIVDVDAGTATQVDGITPSASDTSWRTRPAYNAAKKLIAFLSPVDGTGITILSETDGGQWTQVHDFYGVSNSWAKATSFSFSDAGDRFAFAYSYNGTNPSWYISVYGVDESNVFTPIISEISASGEQPLLSARCSLSPDGTKIVVRNATPTPTTSATSLSGYSVDTEEKLFEWFPTIASTPVTLCFSEVGDLVYFVAFSTGDQTSPVLGSFRIDNPAGTETQIASIGSIEDTDNMSMQTINHNGKEYVLIYGSISGGTYKAMKIDPQTGIVQTFGDNSTPAGERLWWVAAHRGEVVASLYDNGPEQLFFVDFDSWTITEPVPGGTAPDTSTTFNATIGID